MSWFFSKVISASLRSLEGKRKMCVRSISFFWREKYWRFLPHTKVTFDLRLCHDFDLMSFEQVKGDWKKKFIILAGPYLSNGEALAIPNSHRDCLWPKNISWTRHIKIRNPCLGGISYTICYSRKWLKLKFDTKIVWDL